MSIASCAVRAGVVVCMTFALAALGCDDGRARGGADPSTHPAEAPASPRADVGAPVNPLDISASNPPAAPANPLDSAPAAGAGNPLDAHQSAPPREQRAADATAGRFTGTFHTNYQGSDSVIRIEQSGRNVKGKIDLAVLEGKVDGDVARGDVKNPETGEVGGVFELRRKGEDLELKLTLKDPQSGQTQALPAFTYKSGEPPPQAQNIDPQLVGRWRNTETYVSGDFTAATDTWMILNGDGSYEYGYGKAGAGGAAGSVIADRGDAETGKWRASDRMLQYQENGTGPWQTLARYYVEGDTLMLTYPNGSKKIWYRR